MNLPATTAEYEATKYMITAPKGAKMGGKENLRLWFCKARNPKEAWQKYDNECRSLAIAWGEEG